MSVYIDIPGVGNVEAKNAATEATLKEILKALSGSKGGGAGGGAGAAGKGAAAAANETAKSGNLLTNTFKSLNKLAFESAGAMGKVAVGGVLVGKKFIDVGNASVDLVNKMADVGDSLSSAANVIGQLPVIGKVLGPVFGAVAAAVEKTTAAYQNAAASGATFGGSVNEFSKSASAAGMTMDQFGQLISKNGESLRLLGGTTEEGAKRFSQISKSLRSSSAELYNLGFSTADVNQGLANYTKYLGQTGKLGTKSNAELVDGSKKYLKEMDLLSKITGETRKEQEEARAKLLNDAQYQAKVSNMSTEAGEAFANTVNMLPAGLRDVAKDIMVTGTATTEESQKFAAMMPKSAALMQQYAQVTENGGTITKEMQNRLNNMLAEEGKSAKQQYREIGKYSKEMSGVYMNTVQASNIQTDAVKKAAAAQAKSAKTTDGQAAAMEEAKQSLAEFSNTFSMFLAQSGILDSLMVVFKGLATLVQNVVVPVFKFFADGIKTAVGFVSKILGGEDTKAGFGKIMATVKTLLSTVGGFFESIGTGIDWKGILGNVMTIGKKIFETVNSLIIDLTPIFNTIFDVGQQLFNQLTPIFNDILDVIKIISGVVAPIISPIVETIGSILGGFFSMIGGFVKIVKGILTGDGAKVLEGFGDVIGGFFERLVGIIKMLGQLVAGPVKAVWNLLTGKGSMTDEEKKAEQAEAEKKKTEEKKAAAEKSGNKEELDRLARIEKQKEDYKKAKDKENAAEKKKADDAKKSAADAAKKDQVAVDYNDSMSILKGEIARQQGKAVAGQTPAAGAAGAAVNNKPTATSPAAGAAGAAAKDKPTVTSSAEAGKAALVKESEDKAAADKKAKDEANRKFNEEIERGMAEDDARRKAQTAKPTSAAQESAETLLASLNSKMDQLIKINKDVHNINERQLTVQQGLTGDLFLSV